MNNPNSYRIILFDGVCNVCNSTVDFILSHDKNDRFRFASLQSNVAQELLKAAGYSAATMGSVVLIEEDRIYFKSTAVLRIAKHLNQPYSYAYIFLLIPGFIRDVVYGWIASHRYQWFGRRDQCRTPGRTTTEKFLS